MLRLSVHMYISPLQTWLQIVTNRLDFAVYFNSILYVCIDFADQYYILAFFIFSPQLHTAGGGFLFTHNQINYSTQPHMIVVASFIFLVYLWYCRITWFLLQYPLYWILDWKKYILCIKNTMNGKSYNILLNFKCYMY